MSDTTQLSQIRALLSNPAFINFQELLSLATTPFLIEYLDEHLRSWPEHRRFADTLESARHPLSRYAMLDYKRAPNPGEWELMPHLRRLALMGSRTLPTYTNLRELSCTPGLDFLELYSLELQDLFPLRECPDLHTLLLSGCDIESLKGLGECKKLHSLRLSWCHRNPALHLFSDALSLEPLKEYTSLRNLELGKTPMVSLETLTLLPHLECLSLLEVEIQEFGWMVEMPALRHLRLEGEYGAAPSQVLPSLRHLETLEMLNVPTSFFRSLSIQPNLRELTINQIPELLDVTLLHCQRLQTLRLNRWTVLPDALKMLEKLAGHPSLQTIVLEGEVPLPEGLKRLKQILPDCEIHVPELEQH